MQKIMVLQNILLGMEGMYAVSLLLKMKKQLLDLVHIHHIKNLEKMDYIIL